MSFWKFWGKKSKAKDDLDIRKEDDPEAEKRKLRHSLSISRSGRFKQKKRERGGILDRPELYNVDQPDHDFRQESSACSETSSSASTTSSNSESSSNHTATSSSRSSRPGINQQHFAPPGQGPRRSGPSMQAT